MVFDPYTTFVSQYLLPIHSEKILEQCHPNQTLKEEDFDKWDVIAEWTFYLEDFKTRTKIWVIKQARKRASEHSTLSPRTWWQGYGLGSHDGLWCWPHCAHRGHFKCCGICKYCQENSCAYIHMVISELWSPPGNAQKHTQRHIIYIIWKHKWWRIGIYA